MVRRLTARHDVFDSGCLVNDPLDCHYKIHGEIISATALHTPVGNLRKNRNIPQLHSQVKFCSQIMKITLSK